MASERKKRSSKYLDEEYLNRPSWVNARVAYKQVRKDELLASIKFTKTMLVENWL
ncbi:hypothetical protein ACF0H5_004983 [Mactra antiquata]